MKKVIVALFLLVLVLPCAFEQGSKEAVSAEVEYPTGPVTLICPWAAGGSTDITARAIASVAEARFGSPVVVVNREGGGSTIGTQEVALSTKGDGYTLLVGTINALAVLPHTMGLAYSPANFKAIGQVCSRDMGIICTADKPWNTITDFIQDAKANPGKYLVSCPQGGLQNILFQRLADMTGAQFRVYPVNNDTENLTAVLGGVSDLGVPGSYDVAAGQIAAGQVKVLALFSDTRAASLPNVPTLKELGFDLSFAPWTSLLVPASTPDSLVEKMRGVWREVIQSPELAALLAKNKQKPDYLDGAETQLTIEKQFKDFGETIKSMGLAAK
jgi:tripartite-type tricarboxylate transporter receptor subunit TctC